jgi:hypothetical protein
MMPRLAAIKRACGISNCNSTVFPFPKIQGEYKSRDNGGNEQPFRNIGKVKQSERIISRDKLGTEVESAKFD